MENDVVDGGLEHVGRAFDQPLPHHERRGAGGVSADLNGARTRATAAATEHRVAFDQPHPIERQAQLVTDDASDRAVVMLSRGRTAELDQAHHRRAVRRTLASSVRSNHAGRIEDRRHADAQDVRVARGTALPLVVSPSFVVTRDAGPLGQFARSRLRRSGRR